jgi:uncharacterized protein (TIGR02594 family)
MTPWMDHAWSHVGVSETRGSGATSAIVSMYAKAGHSEVQSDEVPWCAAFVGACLRDAGLSNTGSLMARSYLQYGTKIDAPRVGCIVVLKRGAPPAGHVGFVTGWGDGKIRVLGGNQGDKVCEASYREADVLGYRWPPAAMAPGVVAAPAAKPLWQSRTLLNLGVGTSFLTWLGGLFVDAMQIVTQAGTQFAALGPSREMLATIGGNSTTIAMALGVGCLVSAAAVNIGDRTPKEPPHDPA